jgi:putative hydrolase of HD superfamily
MENKKIVDFLFELAGAKTTPRSGWQRIGIKVPESLADHRALAGQIAYVLASMEGANADHSVALALFGDLVTLRIGEDNWVSRIYRGAGKDEEAAIGDQMAGLSFGGQLGSLVAELKEGATREAVIARDADYLDRAIQAKYYADNGNKKALLWLESAGDSFQTDSAKTIFAAVKDSGIEDWWMELEPMKKKFASLRGQK